MSERAAIAPSVLVVCLAMSAIDSGLKSPTLELAGRNMPFSNVTPSSGTFQMRAARPAISLMTLREQSTSTMPWL